MQITLYVVYLNSYIQSDDFKFLHEFLHEGSLKEGNYAFLCKEIDPSSPYFSLTLVGSGDARNRKIQIPHTYVAAIVEVISADVPFGFVGQKTSLAKST